MSRISIIGAGAWGTALSIVLAGRGHAVRLWVYENDLYQRLLRTRENDVFLPGFHLPDNVVPSNALGDALDSAEIVLTVTPSHVCRTVYRQMLDHLRPDMLFVSATKGLEADTLMRMSEVICNVAGERFTPRLAVLSGPTFAREIARGAPAAVVIASADPGLARHLQAEFSGPTLRLYASSDMTGVELGGSLKNIIAIGAGVCDGLNLGSNALAALITRGLAEITRLATACGAEASTLGGLAGLGDLVLTCTGTLSRNRTLGVELAKGRSLAEIQAGTPTVAEGVKTTSAAIRLAAQRHVEMPITEQMDAMLHHGRSPRQAIRTLMERSLKSEF